MLHFKNNKIINIWNTKFLGFILITSDYLSVALNLHDCSFKQYCYKKKSTDIKPSEVAIQWCTIKSAFVQPLINHIR